MTLGDKDEPATAAAAQEAAEVEAPAAAASVGAGTKAEGTVASQRISKAPTQEITKGH
jgi:hypothetical protein